MGEISNKTLALLVLASLVVVVVATTIQLNRLNGTGLTGFATSDTGDVNLSIQSSLSIEVDSVQNIIDFKNCTAPAAGTSVVDSNDTTDNPTCHGDTTTPQRIQINNIGNEHANITISAVECDVATFIPEDTPGGADFEMGTYGYGCSLGYAWLSKAAYTTVVPNVVLCENLTIGSSMNVSARVTIPNDAQAASNHCGGNNQNTITFAAAISDYN